MKKLISLLVLVAMMPVARAQTSPSLTWYWTAPSQFTDGKAIPSTNAITYNVLLGTAGPGSELTVPNQTGDKFASAVTSGAYTAGMIVCVRIVAVDAAPNTIPSVPSVEFCQVYEPPSQQVSPVTGLNDVPPGS
jgi:hypothetical protein